MFMFSATPSAKRNRPKRRRERVHPPEGPRGGNQGARRIPSTISKPGPGKHWAKFCDISTNYEAPGRYHQAWLSDRWILGASHWPSSVCGESEETIPGSAREGNMDSNPLVQYTKVGRCVYTGPQRQQRRKFCTHTSRWTVSMASRPLASGGC